MESWSVPLYSRFWRFLEQKINSSIRGFFYSPKSYMINVLKINCGLLPTHTNALLCALTSRGQGDALVYHNLATYHDTKYTSKFT